MKKWYKKCPFCANEIKEWAIKCQFCEEFLDWRNSEKTENSNVEISKQNNSKKYWFRWRFFRKDLSLNKKWWHRMLMIIFFILLVFFPIKRTINIMNELYDYRRTEVVDSVENRIWNDISKVSSLLDYSEYIETSYWIYDIWDFDQYRAFNKNSDWYIERDDKFYTEMYCAKNWDIDKINSLADKTGLWYLSMVDWRKWKPTAVQINNEIKKYRCVLPDTLNWKRFLNHEFEALDNLYIVKQTTKSMRYWFRWRFGEHYLPFQALILIPWCLIILIYYKVIIYIIYWSYKKNS